MSAPSFLPATLLTTSTVLALTVLSGCNNHTLVGVRYDNNQVCDESVNVPVVKPQVVLVVDRSGSMSDNPLSEGTRWEALHGVISEVVGGQDRNTQFGLAMFPAGSAGDTFPEGACDAATALDVPVGEATGEAIIAALPGALDTTHGGTPAAAAIQLAADHLRGLDDSEPKLMILVTDGAANCGDESDWQTATFYDEGLQDAVAQAQIDGITTYVVGIQIDTTFDDTSGVVPAEQLDEVAILGGAPLGGEHQFYGVEDQAALGQALDAITANLGCTMELGSEVDPEREALLQVGGEIQPEVDSCEGQDGWMYVEGEDGLAISLCGQSCANFQASGTISLDYICGA